MVTQSAIGRAVLRYSVAASLLLVFSITVQAQSHPSKSATRWTDQFDTPACTWSSTGRNDLFILEPGYQLIFEGHEGKDHKRLVITVLEETKKVAGVETRVIEERETRNGDVIEVSRNFFAICSTTNDAFYFGEDVDMYKGGKVVSHEGSWNADNRGARAGLFMPARPLLGARYYQELAPKVAMDRIEIVSDSESLVTPAGEFHRCVKTEETTPLEPGVKDYKVFARGIGLVKDGELLLTKYGPASKTPR